jgi:hypothetical protein
VYWLEGEHAGSDHDDDDDNNNNGNDVVPESFAATSLVAAARAQTDHVTVAVVVSQENQATVRAQTLSPCIVRGG